ncbi:GNL3L/Grn1 putative GTPase-domain-containing protein [Pavlovales sp. CCMP2436]|nr:GNL3L/Grn1 putative GTPase-domain-containing protein [Pavlovales sp. CCMP2436]
MGKIPKKKSKRILIKDQNKIARKVRQHHKKQRREAKKNPNKFKPKDPGIPNSWPFKQELLAEMEQGREEERTMHERARAYKEVLRLRAASQKIAKQVRSGPSAKQVAAASDVSTLSEAHVLLLCVDARDPPAGRCAELEQRFLQGAGGANSLIVLLNRAHLVPPENLAAWLDALRSAGVAAAPFCTTVDESARASSRSKQKALKAVGATEVCELLGQLALAEGAVPHADLLKVAVVGATGLHVEGVLQCLQLRLKKKCTARGHVTLLERAVVLEPRLGAGALPDGNTTAGQANTDLAQYFATAAEKEAAAGEGAHLVLAPSECGIGCELVAALEEHSEKKSLRRVKHAAAVDTMEQD